MKSRISPIRDMAFRMYACGVQPGPARVALLDALERTDAKHADILQTCTGA